MSAEFSEETVKLIDHILATVRKDMDLGFERVIAEFRSYLLGGIAVGIPVILGLLIALHKNLHPLETFVGEKGKELDILLRKLKDIDELKTDKEKSEITPL